MNQISAQHFTTDRGNVSLAYEGDTGSKVWTWRFEDGTVETQLNVSAMVVFKSQINAR